MTVISWEILNKTPYTVVTVEMLFREPVSASSRWVGDKLVREHDFTEGRIPYYAVCAADYFRYQGALGRASRSSYR